MARKATQPNENKGRRAGQPWPASAEYAVAAAAMLFIALISVFAIRNNDVWWHLAVGKELIRSSRFITHDPFMFSVVGAPWVPHAWLSSVVLFGVHSLAGAAGLVALRAVIVVTIFAVLLRVLRRLDVSLTLASPVLLLAVLNSHSRFIMRPHLFEYLLIVLLLAHLVGGRSGRGDRVDGASGGPHDGRTRDAWRVGLRFYLFPVILQMLWVNVHASFYLGIAIVVLFYSGEALSQRFAGSLGTRSFLSPAQVHWRPVGLLILLMTAVSFMNPSPLAFVFQPLNAEHRELLTKYTLEWRSPFDPLLRGGAFHPYYELLLAFVTIAFVASVNRLKLASLFIVGAFAVLSLQAHRFRVEFSLVALPLVLDQLSVSRPFENLKRGFAAQKRGSAWVPYIACVALALVLAVTARDRIEFDGAVSDRFPKEAFAFVKQADIAQRPFHSVGHGSYLIWALYPERQTFVDGRNIEADLYRDFLACQTNSAGFNGVIRKYKLDSFILPAPEKADGGMTNVHRFLMESKGWSLAYLDRNAYVYVKNNTVPPAWLLETQYHFYHPLTVHQLRFTAQQVDSVAVEMRRAVDTDPRYARPGIDLARFYGAIGDVAAARETVQRVLLVHPENSEARTLLQRIDSLPK